MGGQASQNLYTIRVHTLIPRLSAGGRGRETDSLVSIVCACTKLFVCYD